MLAALLSTGAGCDETAKPSGSGQNSDRTNSSASRDDDAGTTPRTPPRGQGGSGSTSPTEAACATNARRLAPAGTPAQCLDCICETISTCGATCEKLGLCVVARCSDSLGDPVAASRCASVECGGEIESSDLSSIAKAVTALAECRSVCQLPDVPDADAGASEDAGSEEPTTADAGN